MNGVSRYAIINSMSGLATGGGDGRQGPHRVVVVGGGIAGLEAVLALRSLVGEVASLTLVSDRPSFDYMPARLFQATTGQEPPLRDLAAFAADFGIEFVQARIDTVDPDSRQVIRADGEAVRYDDAVICPGARWISRFRNAPPLVGAQGSPTVVDVMERAATHPSRRVALIVPPGESWTLPIYELALMCARVAAERDMSVDIVVVTPEAGPLIMFGPNVSDRVYDLLRARGVSVLPSTYAHEDEDGSIALTPGGHVLDAGAAAALPAHEGPDIDGLPTDSAGFIPIDNHARVRGCEGLYAAGDGTNFPIKQGGLAAQQADAAAEQIAAELGVLEDPKPFHPVLRGKFLLGEPALYMSTDVAGGSGEGDVSEDRLWWPPLKVGARYLGPLLAGGPVEEADAVDRPPLDVEVNLTGEWHDDWGTPGESRQSSP